MATVIHRVIDEAHYGVQTEDMKTNARTHPRGCTTLRYMIALCVTTYAHAEE